MKSNKQEKSVITPINIISFIKYKKFLILLFLVYGCKNPEQSNNVKSYSKTVEAITADTCNTHRTIKIYFCTNTLIGDAPLKLYSNSVFKIHNTELSIDIKDTITLNLPLQNHDTIFIKDKKDKNYRIGRLIKFKHGVIYKWCVNSCSSNYSFFPQNVKRDTIHPTVSFNIKNYKGKNSIIGIRGLDQDEDTILLKNNIKSEYYRFLSMSAMCNSDPKRIAIENIDKKITIRASNGKKYEENLTYFEIWFDDIHGEKLDVTYDFKTKQSNVSVVE